MTVQVARTKAEAALIAGFDKIAGSLPGGGNAARRGAIARFAEVGLPHRRIEEWKYTDVRNAIKEAYEPAPPSADAISESDVERALGPLAGLDAHRIVFVDGHLVPGLSRREGCGAVVKIMSRGEASALETSRDRRSTALDGVLSLNDAFVTDGAAVHLTASASKPLMIVHISRAAAPSRTTLRHAIELADGVTATLIDVRCVLGSKPLQASEVTNVRLGAGAALCHVRVLGEGAGATRLDHTDVAIGERAGYRGFQLTTGGALVRNETHVTFEGPDAKLDLSGVMLGRGSDHIDTTLVVNHETLGCESRELFKAVLDDRARAVFQGKVIVQPVAQQTDGKQMSQALLLSEDAEFDSKPELEIYADDVACGHGATAAELDSAMLFYLMSRGIPRPEARGMLIESFVGEAIDKIEDEALREVVMGVARGWLQAK